MMNIENQYTKTRMIMKKAILTLLLGIVCIAAGATQQINDKVQINGEEWELTSSPLEYLQSKTADAFRALLGERDFIMTSNYRGYIAYWYVDRHRLYLDRIEIPQMNGTYKTMDQKELKKVFRRYGCCSRIKAGWLTGNLRIGKGIGPRDPQNPHRPVFEEEKTIVLKHGRMISEGHEHINL